ncbi:hypothetical protein PENSPDRAFT_658421 [Peniophora sp. CONT]|nr:hypothetical protein PENSPDRAFT_658421 [Peniophora sp. CONT]
MIDLLAQLPLLEDLSLEYLRFTESNAVDVLNRTYGAQVSLPHIHTLLIGDFADFVLFYMRLLDVPLHPDLSLNCTVTPRGTCPMGFNNPYYAELFPILKRYLTVVSNHPLKVLFPGPRAYQAWCDPCPIVRCDMADIHISIRNQDLPNHAILPLLLPDTAYEATLVCDTIIPQTIWTAMLEHTSSYLRCILFSDIGQLSSCPLAQADHDTPSLPNLREIVLTKPQNMAEEKCRSHFSAALRLLHKATVVLVFEAGTQVDEGQMEMLKKGMIKYKVQATTGERDGEGLTQQRWQR